MSGTGDGQAGHVDLAHLINSRSEPILLTLSSLVISPATTTMAWHGMASSSICVAYWNQGHAFHDYSFFPDPSTFRVSPR